METINFVQALDKDGKPYIPKPVRGYYYTSGRVALDKKNAKYFNVNMDSSVLNSPLDPNNHYADDPNVDPNTVEFTPQKKWWVNKDQTEYHWGDSPPGDNEDWDFNKKTYDWGKYPCDNFPNEDYYGEINDWSNYRNKNLKEIDEKKKKIRELELQLKVLKLETENAELREHKAALKRESKHYKKMNEMFSKRDKKEFDKQKKEREFYAMP